MDDIKHIISPIWMRAPKVVRQDLVELYRLGSPLGVAEMVDGVEVTDGYTDEQLKVLTNESMAKYLQDNGIDASGKSTFETFFVLKEFVFQNGVEMRTFFDQVVTEKPVEVSPTPVELPVARPLTDAEEEAIALNAVAQAINDLNTDTNVTTTNEKSPEDKETTSGGVDTTSKDESTQSVSEGQGVANPKKPKRLPRTK